MRHEGRGAAGRWTVLAMAVTAVIAAAPAGAASYKVVECVPDYGGIGALDAVGYAEGMGPTLTDTCTPPWSFNGLIASGQDVGEQSSPASNGWRFLAPPGTQFTNAVMLARGSSQGGVFPEIFSFDAQGGGFQWANTGGAMPTSNAWLGWNGEGGTASKIDLRVRCNATPCGDSGGAFITASHFGFTLSDNTGPQIDRVGGPLVETPPSRSLRGKVGVGISASDVGSGLRVAYVDAGDKRLGGSFYDCGVTSDGQGRSLVPCPREGARLFLVETASGAFYTGLNHGPRACVVDFAGQTTCQETPDIRVDNACPDAGPGVASLSAVRFNGGVASSGGANVKETRFGRKVKLRGQALDAGGNPVAGATICLGHHLAGDTCSWMRTAPKRSVRCGRSKRMRPRYRRRYVAVHLLKSGLPGVMPNNIRILWGE